MQTRLTQASAFVTANGMDVRAVVADLDTLNDIWNVKAEVPDFGAVRTLVNLSDLRTEDKHKLLADLNREERYWINQSMYRHRPRYSAIATWLAIAAATVVFWCAAFYGICCWVWG